MAQAQKLESIGHLAAGIAHEINTPIQYVSDNLRFLEVSFGKLDEMLSAYDRLLGPIESGPACPAAVSGIHALAVATRLSYLRSEIPQSIEDSLEGVSRVAEIVRAIKDFSHPGPLEKAATDLNRAIELAPNFAFAYHRRAMTYKGKGEEALSRQDREKAAMLEGKVK